METSEYQHYAQKIIKLKQINASLVPDYAYSKFSLIKQVFTF